MDHPYSVWADVLDKFHTSSDWIQALWLMVSPVTVLGVTWLFVRGVRETVSLLRDRREPCGHSIHAAYEEPRGSCLFLARRHGLTRCAYPNIPADERTPG
jgi:hypothetical protein